MAVGPLPEQWRSSGVLEFSLRPGECLRRARPTDNAAVVALFGQVPMRGDVVVSSDRTPDFFALYAMQKGVAECWVFERNGSVCGCCALLIRPGWLNGEKCTVGYLGDLRAKASAFGVLTRYYALLLEYITSLYGVKQYYTAVMASNKAALAALTSRRQSRASQPAYVRLCEHDAVQVTFVTRPRRRAFPYVVRTATSNDMQEVVDLLAADQRRKPFGYCFEEGELEHRIENWPGFVLDQTYVVRDSSGTLAGVTTLWDANAVKRYRVHAYSQRMRWVVRALRLSALVRKHPPLPRAGECFRYAYLCNLAIANEDPDILSALLQTVFSDTEARSYHFVMLCMEPTGAMNAALQGYHVERLRFVQFTVGPASVSSGEVRSSGFEIALA